MVNDILGWVLVSRRRCWNACWVVGEMGHWMIRATGLVVQTLWLPQTSHHLRCMSMPFCSISTMLKALNSLRDNSGSWLNDLLISLCLLTPLIEEIMKMPFNSASRFLLGACWWLRLHLDALGAGGSESFCTVSSGWSREGDSVFESVTGPLSEGWVNHLVDDLDNPKTWVSFQDLKQCKHLIYFTYFFPWAFTAPQDNHVIHIHHYLNTAYSLWSITHISNWISKAFLFFHFINTKIHKNDWKWEILANYDLPVDTLQSSSWALHRAQRSLFNTMKK